MDRDETMIIAGIGFSSACTTDELATLLAGTGTRIDALATPATKAHAPIATDLATQLGLKLHAITTDALAAAQPRCLTHSNRAARETGFPSIAEACALAAAGPGARLLLPRIASAHATCALAEGPCA